ncbi:hypothetical protein RF11_05709 [Thelohanellus kitauei]|uniref:Uncharacterized protein n=1 Tax=Thelohanellus kitauei TaxID=669202 RepID=A0A0C2JB59_THEKT|nr:hypothetical protein RF11_05709 [Thelohanellus kitauei]
MYSESNLSVNDGNFIGQYSNYQPIENPNFLDQELSDEYSQGEEIQVSSSIKNQYRCQNMMGRLININGQITEVPAENKHTLYYLVRNKENFQWLSSASLLNLIQNPLPSAICPSPTLKQDDSLSNDDHERIFENGSATCETKENIDIIKKCL